MWWCAEGEIEIEEIEEMVQTIHYLCDLCLLHGDSHSLEPYSIDALPNSLKVAI